MSSVTVSREIAKEFVTRFVFSGWWSSPPGISELSAPCPPPLARHCSGIGVDAPRSRNLRRRRWPFWCSPPEPALPSLSLVLPTPQIPGKHCLSGSITGPGAGPTWFKGSITRSGAPLRLDKSVAQPNASALSKRYHARHIPQYQSRVMPGRQTSADRFESVSRTVRGSPPRSPFRTVRSSRLGSVRASINRVGSNSMSNGLRPPDRRVLTPAATRS
jgi:hypothetical protein